MSICTRLARREKKPREDVYTAVPPPTAKPYTIYLLTDAEMDERRPGAAAFRSGLPDGGDDGTEYCAFRFQCFPRACHAEAHYRVGDIMRSFTRRINKDIFLHEVGGHEVLGYGHDAPNAVMQDGEFRKTRSAEEYSMDRQELALAIMEEYTHIEVQHGLPEDR